MPDRQTVNARGCAQCPIEGPSAIFRSPFPCGCGPQPRSDPQKRRFIRRRALARRLRARPAIAVQRSGLVRPPPRGRGDRAGPGFDRLITLDANTIKELPHQIEVALTRPSPHGRTRHPRRRGRPRQDDRGRHHPQGARRARPRAPRAHPHAGVAGRSSGRRAREQVLRAIRHADASRRMAERDEGDRLLRSRHPARVTQRRSCVIAGTSSSSTRRTRSRTTTRHDYQFIQKIDRNYLLLLTATPLQNDLRELYNLVTLLRPGQLGTWREFRNGTWRGGDRESRAIPRRSRSSLRR